MIINLNERVCAKHKMSPIEVCIALAIRGTSNFKEVVRDMKRKGVFTEEDGSYVMTQEWNNAVDKILKESGETAKNDKDLLDLAIKMRELYPEGKMRDKFGKVTPYYYRCNNHEVVKKLKKFFAIYGNVPDEDILDATKRYVASFQGNYTGMRLIKYFILKDDVKPSEDGVGHVEQISDLATFLENRESGEGNVTNSDDWLLKIKN